jgi:uncharacterized protein YrzB (UPF0473 family)
MQLSTQDEVLTLLDEEGKEHRFEVIDILQVNESDYAILLPLEAENELDSEVAEDEAVIFRIVDEGEENQTLMAVEDEEEWELVASAWEEKVLEMDDEEDDAYLEDEEEEV